MTDGGPDDADHRLLAPDRLRYPGGKDGMWVVRCACGYATAPYPTPQAAGKPAGQHLDAKTGSPSDVNAGIDRRGGS